MWISYIRFLAFPVAAVAWLLYQAFIMKRSRTQLKPVIGLVLFVCIVDIGVFYLLK
jgi:hypothetical protein